MDHHNTGDHTIQQLDKQFEILRSLMDGQSELRDLLQLGRTSIPGEDVSDDRQSPLPIIGIKAYPTQYQKTPCSPFCGCRCHDIHSTKSPKALHELVGMLFIGYSGCPLRMRQNCTEISCISQSPFRANVKYLFPSWFLATAITATLVKTFLAEIRVSLAVRRIIPTGAEIFRLQKTHDIDGLRPLFSKGLASPNDSSPFGNSLLIVSNILILSLYSFYALRRCGC